MTRDAQSLGTVRSSDGAAIAFERGGDGPALILVGGALSSGVRSFGPFVELARLLERRFTVYRFDRRGRGDSGDAQPYRVEREVEDLQALVSDAGGAAAVYGFSSGAVLGVEAAARGAGITKLVLLEPPLPSGAGDDELAQTDEMIRGGRRGDAVASFLAGVGLPPEAVEGMRQSPEWLGLEAMAHTLLYDGVITEDAALWDKRAGKVSVPTLVLFSDGTSAYLGDSARRAADSIPNAVSRTLPGQFHDIDSETLASELEAFLSQWSHEAGQSPADAGNPNTGRPASFWNDARTNWPHWLTGAYPVRSLGGTPSLIDCPCVAQRSLTAEQPVRPRTARACGS